MLIVFVSSKPPFQSTPPRGGRHLLPNFVHIKTISNIFCEPGIFLHNLSTSIIEPSKIPFYFQRAISIANPSRNRCPLEVRASTVRQQSAHPDHTPVLFQHAPHASSSSLPENKTADCLLSHRSHSPNDAAIRPIVQDRPDIQIPKAAHAVLDFCMSWQPYAVASCPQLSLC